ncbi:hypothetical protein A85_11200 [Streptococcus pyogenes]|nr:hypothetical protein A85_11200 [Streptococcus pyogenes]
MVILRNKEDWRVYPEELARRSRDSVRVVRTCLEELERVGYVRTYRKSLGRGKGIQYYRFCSDKKISEAIKKKSIIIAALTVMLIVVSGLCVSLKSYYEPQIYGLRTQLSRTQKQLKRASEQNQRQTKRIADLTNNGG